MHLDSLNADAWFHQDLIRRHLGDRAGAIADPRHAAALYQRQGSAPSAGSAARAEQALRTLGA